MPDNKEKYAKLQEVIEKHKGERGAVMDRGRTGNDPV